jgi:hypothetical protein
MASAQNNIEIDDFEGFQFLVFFEDNYIYMKISNNETKSLYEKIIEEYDLDDIGNITNLNDLFIFFQKGLYQDDEYEIRIIETDSQNLELLLEKQINEEQKIQSNLYLPKKFSEDEEQKKKIDETENKHQIEIQRIQQEHRMEIQRIQEEHQMEIQRIREKHQNGIQRIREEHQTETQHFRHRLDEVLNEFESCQEERDTMFVCFGTYKPFNSDDLYACVPQSVTDLGIVFEYQPRINANYSHGSCYLDLNKKMAGIKITGIYKEGLPVDIYNEIKKLKNLKKLRICRNVSLGYTYHSVNSEMQQKIRNYCSSKGIECDIS